MKNFKNRFIFIPVILLIMMTLIIIYRLMSSTDIFKIDFTDIDRKLIPQSDVLEYPTNIKNSLIPKTENSGNGEVDINNADMNEIDSLPDIGAKRAEAIVKQREKMGGFSTLEDLMCTDGIGIKLFNNVKPYIKISEYTRMEE